MLKKTITYTNYNDEKKTADFYFNLKKSELIDMQYSTPQGFIDYLDKITKTENQVEIWRTFRDIILKAYGEKSEDGERFIKTPEGSKAFEETEAFSELIYELMTSSSAAADFINGIMPRDLVESAKQEQLHAVD